MNSKERRQIRRHGRILPKPPKIAKPGLVERLYLKTPLLKYPIAAALLIAFVVLATGQSQSRKIVKPVIPAPPPCSLTSEVPTQGTFDSALNHAHGQPELFEGEWDNRDLLPATHASAYLMGNSFTIERKTASRVDQRRFLRAFGREDSLFISLTLYSHPTVRVTYDPECCYALAVEIVEPQIEVDPAPGPQPKPTIPPRTKPKP